MFNRYVFDRTNVFGVREGAIGEYDDHSIFLFAYDSPEESKRWYDSARDFLRQSERFDNFVDVKAEFQIDDSYDYRLTVAARGRWILIVRGKSGLDAQKLISRCERSLW